MSATQQNGSIMMTITETLNQLSSMSTSVAAATEEQYAVSQTIAEDAANVMKTASTSHEAALKIKDLAKQLDGAQQELQRAYQQFTL
jgi:methyl-accepting chemotaxis protein